MDIKKILKAIKLNEETISTALGIAVVILAVVLVFNYFKKGGKEGKITPAEQTQIEETQKEETKEGIYTVKKGQSLWAIAEEVYGSGFNWTDIAKANNINNPNLIEEGQELKLPQVEKSTATVTKPAEKIEKDTYTVVRGDSLWKIAVRAYGDGYRWVDIAKANKLTNPNLIHSGNVLVIPR